MIDLHQPQREDPPVQEAGERFWLTPYTTYDLRVVNTPNNDPHPQLQLRNDKHNTCTDRAYPTSRGSPPPSMPSSWENSASTTSSGQERTGVAQLLMTIVLAIIIVAPPHLLGIAHRRKRSSPGISSRSSYLTGTSRLKPWREQQPTASVPGQPTSPRFRT